jgi:hypothetical protein
MTTPEPTPQEKALKRVLKISRLNGWSVIIFAGLGILIALALGDLVGAFIGLLVGVAGWMEVRGHNKLKRRDPDGMVWLVRSQMFLLSVILVYCASRLGSFDNDTMLSGLTPEMEAMLKESGIERADLIPLVRMTFFATYFGVAALTILYQGGMAIYYKRKTKLVTEALKAAPILPPRPSALPPSI